MSTSLAEVLGKKRPRSIITHIVVDDSLRDEYEEVLAEIGSIKRREAWDGGDMASPSLSALEARRDELAAAMAEARIPFRFEAMPRTRWLSLLDEYDVDGSTEELPDDFAKAMVLHSLVDPAADADQVDQMWEAWSLAETDQLVLAAWRVNREVRDIPFTVAGTDTTSTTGSRSTTAPSEVSPGQSS